MYKKACRTCKVVFFLDKTTVFWMFSLLSLSSLLKLPISPDDNLYTVAYR